MRDPVAIQTEKLVRLLTQERLASYRESAGSIQQALALYEWNINMSAAVLATSAAVEVLVRNSMDIALQSWALARGYQDWLDAAPLDAKGREAIAAARNHLQLKCADRTEQRPIPALTFGFWRYLVTSRYLTTLWLPSLQHAFPFGPEDPLKRRQEVHFAMQQLVFLRNRAAHHEPIHRRDLLQDHNTAINLAAMVDPVAGEWVARRSTIPAVMAAKPRIDD